ncbi:MAG: YbhB/YbcL family Raf kinase inhibitor-like protein [Thalassobius sp.]|nr:YbhB/YbcL family Raf kinase inhibitor-like protein [Thalassovita sp.]
MKKITFTFIAILATFIISQAQTFTLKSTSVGGQASSENVFNGFGCTGDNSSPALSWENAPEGTKSFAITMYDPDAPTGSGWWHWVMFDVPADVKSLKKNAGSIEAQLAPKNAIQSITDYGAYGYGGPCPPEGHGPHQYIVTVYALKTDKLGVDKNASPALVGFNLTANTIEKASIVFYYQR